MIARSARARSGHRTLTLTSIAPQIILLLISADFLASDYCYSVEMQRAQQRHEAGEARVIPVILRPVDWQHEPLLHKLQALPTSARPVTDWPAPPTHDAAFTDIARGIRRVVEELTGKPVGASSARIGSGSVHPQVWNVPYRRNPFFTDREDLLAQLHERLGATGAAALIQPQAHAISGLGGIGKTQIAIEYAYRYRDDYRFVLWVSATPESLLTDVVKLAVLLGLPEQQEQDQAITVAAVQRWLTTHLQWLLILDNADDLEVVRDFLPAESPEHVLLTTREQAAGSIAQPISVERMDQHFCSGQCNKQRISKRSRYSTAIGWGSNNDGGLCKGRREPAGAAPLTANATG